MRVRTLFGSCLALTLLAGTVLAGGQQIAVEVARGGGSLLVRTYRCGTPAEIVVAGTARGMVDGKERTIDLEVQRTNEPGVFSVARQWPAEGRWVLTFSTTAGHFVNALVELRPGRNLEIASQESTVQRITQKQVAEALQR